MHVQHNAIAAFWRGCFGREYSHQHIWSVRFDAFDGNILCFADWKDRAAAGNQDAGRA
jgi:hypothetical protein